MNVLFLGGIDGNTGPANANKGFVEHWPSGDRLCTVQSGTKMGKLSSLVRGALIADVVLSVGPGKLNSIARAIAKLRGKPIVAFCHGYAPYENKVNRLGMTEAQVNSYKRWLDDCDCVVANSALQMKFLASQQPSLEGKLTYVNLGIEPFDWPGANPRPDSGLVVAVSGGTRPIKANEIVARAIGLLRARGIDAKLIVYGRRYSSNKELDSLVEEESVSFAGQVGREDFLDGLRRSSIFVMNSRREPFGLSALDALEVGTSVLLYRNCGVVGPLGLGPSDLVDDCEDPEEVARKIMEIVASPNAERIYRGLNFDLLGWQNSSLRLRNICAAAAGVEQID